MRLRILEKDNQRLTQANKELMAKNNILEKNNTRLSETNQELLAGRGDKKMSAVDTEFLEY